MLKSMRLERFKAFREAEVDFAPLTIFTGPNSSGKSSLIQGINAVLQSTNGRGFPFDVVLNGELAQLGGIRNVVHGHDARRPFKIALAFNDESGGVAKLAGSFAISTEEGHLFPRLASIECSAGQVRIEWSQRGQKFAVKVAPSSTLVTANRNRIAATVQQAASSDSKELGPIREMIQSLNGDIDRAISILNDAVNSKDVFAAGTSVNATSIDELRDQLKAARHFEPICRQAQEAAVALRSRVAYIGPIRAVPSRFYPISGSTPAVGVVGEGTSARLATWKERHSAKITVLKEALVGLQLASEINAHVELEQFLKIMVKPFGRTYTDSIADVGFGVSQALPYLVADADLPRFGTLIINQPEIHLHPSSQALLGDYFAARIHSRQYVIETHSEYLLNRIRLLVAKGKISSKQVRLIYCGVDDKGGSTIHNIVVEKDGSLSGAPRDFFDTYSGDAFGLAMAVMEAGDASQ